jgi:hypothetical protein
VHPSVDALTTLLLGRTLSTSSRGYFSKADEGCDMSGRGAGEATVPERIVRRCTQAVDVRSGLALLTCAVLVACASSGGDPADATRKASSSPSASPTPSTAAAEPVGLVALGHSGMTGENSDPSSPGAEAKQNSWATGTAPGLNSIYQRMVALRPDTQGLVANAASGGAAADQLQGQAVSALQTVPNPELVIIQTIDDDIRCDGTDAQHVTEFGASIQQALQTISDASPNTKVLIITQPGRPATELKAMATAIASNPSAKAVYTGPAPCGMYDEATGKLMPSRVKALTRIIAAYEAEQQRVCAKFPTCMTDEGGLATFRRSPATVSSDFNHLNAAGLADLAEAVWPYAERALSTT